MRPGLNPIFHDNGVSRRGYGADNIGIRRLFYRCCRDGVLWKQADELPGDAFKTVIDLDSSDIEKGDMGKELRLRLASRPDEAEGVGIFPCQVFSGDG